MVSAGIKGKQSREQQPRKRKQPFFNDGQLKKKENENYEYSRHVRKNTGKNWQVEGDVAHKDVVLPAVRSRIAREALDNRIIDRYNAVQDATPLRGLRKFPVQSNGDPGVADEASRRQQQQPRSTLTPLVKACLRALVSNITEPLILEGLSYGGGVPQPLVRPFLRRVHKAFAAGQMQAEIPFRIWKVLVQSFDADDIPEELRVYEGVACDDGRILRFLNTFNASLSGRPRFSTLTILDLSNTSFSGSLIWEVRPVFSDTLVALRLDSCTDLSNDHIKDLTRDAGEDREDRSFKKLQILSIKGCKQVTDGSLRHIAKFSVLKMLDLRGSGCAAAKEVLLTATKPPFFTAFTFFQRRLFSNEPLTTTYARLQELTAAPHRKAAPEEEAAESMRPTPVPPPCLLVTEYKRIDESKVSDPRDVRADNPHCASHHAYGTIYTTRPINRDALAEVGGEETSRGAAFRTRHPGVMGGELSMARVDLNWKRRQSRPKVTRTLETSSGTNTVDDSDSDLEDVADATVDDTDDPGTHLDHPQTSNDLSGFYARPPPIGTEPEAVEVPAKHDLMLLRFFSASGSDRSQSLLSVKRKEHADDNAVLQVKKKIPKSTATPSASALSHHIFDGIVARPSPSRPPKATKLTGPSSQRPSKPSPLAENHVVSDTAAACRPLRPPGIVSRRGLSAIPTVTKSWNG